MQQVQINSKIGLDFANTLRSILRQDPDKIMIGEIRDKETLEIAIKSALTGHLVLSTLHTNDAISAISRMVDMGVESYLISGVVVNIQAQRLLRKICTHCRTVDNTPQIPKELEKFISKESIFYKANGCIKCNGSGYLGREMVCEVLEISEYLASLIAKGATKEILLVQAKKDGFITILQNSMEKVTKGITTISEVLRVIK